MEFVGEISRADGEVESLYVESDLHALVAAYITKKLRTLNDGDSLTISRTK